MNKLNKLFYRFLSMFINVIFYIISSIHKESSAVFLFHIVTDDNQPTSNYEVSKSSLEDFIKHLRHKGYNCMPLDQILKANPKEKNCTFTFDDASDSVFYHVYPLMVKYQVYFTVFISTQFINKEGYLTADQIRTLSMDSLCDIQSHGLNHIFYRQLSKLDCLKEFEESKRGLKSITNKRINTFAFPYGSFYACSIKNICLLKRTDYDFGFSTLPGNLRLRSLTGSYFIPRINVTEEKIKKFCIP